MSVRRWWLDVLDWADRNADLLAAVAFIATLFVLGVIYAGETP